MRMSKSEKTLTPLPSTSVKQNPQHKVSQNDFSSSVRMKANVNIDNVTVTESRFGCKVLLVYKSSVTSYLKFNFESARIIQYICRAVWKYPPHPFPPSIALATQARLVNFWSS